jgi:hypothetical protein
MIDDLQKLLKNPISTDYIETANTFFGNGLSAALEFGNPAFLEADLEWVMRLLASGKYPSGDPSNIIPYLMAYIHALRHIIGEAGTPITDWLGIYIAKNQAASQ